MDIPFESFCALVYRLGHPPRVLPQGAASSEVAKHLSPAQIFASWLNHQPKPFVAATGKRLFRLLFPHEGSRRRYGLKDTKLARELERVLCVEGLVKWDAVVVEGEAGTGCLGREVELAVRRRAESSAKSEIMISEVDRLLDLLAASSPFSQLSQPAADAPSTGEILSRLFRRSNLSPYAASVLVQIILRDLRPLLSPLPRLPIRNPTAMLRLKATTGPAQLELAAAMHVWDRQMPELYFGGMGDLDKCANMVEACGAGPGGPAEGILPRIASGGPVVGVNISIPKCRKGRSVEDALNEFTGSSYAPPARTIWAESKYDGFRMQIHVEMIDARPKITIFSKSKRDATMDRLNAHANILAALGLEVAPELAPHMALASRLRDLPAPSRTFRKAVVLEAEVVPYNEGQRDGARGPGIEEFWHLDAAGVTRDPRQAARSWSWQNRSRHLCVVFFDVLYLDGQNLLTSPYSTRRRVLESTVREVKGFSMLAERTCIPLSLGRATALATLREAFAASSARHEEGLVLKAEEGTYTRMAWRWVKLKKDYIPNLGDCIDLVLLGAGWDIDRARDLRVDTSVLTTFFLGVLVNPEAVKAKLDVPCFEVVVRASYGLSREQLQVINENIRFGRWPSKSYDKDDPFKKRLVGLSYKVKDLPPGIKPPCLLFEHPMCAEVMGAGFQKLPNSDLFELRWPRLQKIHDVRERPYTAALSSRDLILTAHAALGYDPSAPVPSPEQDSLRAMWRAAHSVSISVVDIPDTPSPVRSSARRLTGRDELKRVASAPELGEILEIGKLSPPTPTRKTGRSVGLTPSPCGHAILRPGKAAEAAGRLQSALLDGENAVTDAHPRVRLMTPRTPSRSPRKRSLASPMTSPLDLRPAKAAKPAAVFHSPRLAASQTKQVESFLPTPPPSSPPLAVSARKTLSPLSDPGQIQAEKPMPLQLVERCFGKALSLRSRLKLAAIGRAREQ